MKIVFKGKSYYLYKHEFGKSVRKHRPKDDDGFEIYESLVEKPFFYYQINARTELIYCLTKKPKSEKILIKRKFSSRPDIIHISSNISNVISPIPGFYRQTSIYSVKIKDINNIPEFFEEVQKQVHAH